MRFSKLFFLIGWLVALCASGAFLMLFSAFLDLRAKERLTSVQAIPTMSATIVPETWTPAAKRVLLVGDSRIRSWSNLPTTQGVVFATSGVGGETSGQLERRFERDVLSLSLSPNDIIIATGINDLVAASLFQHYGEDYQSYLVIQLVTRLESYVTQAQARGVTVKVATIIQPAAPDFLRSLTFWDDSLMTLVGDANAQIKDMANRRGITVIDFNAILDGENGPLPDLYSVDTLHFSAAAYDALNDALIEEYNAP
jgi:lysophospholipase L1-like esterase